uniref:Allophycocyanin beta 18 subunit n=1 Tax=Platysiphonia delicata TaxID=2006979 RepID=A0A1Z1M103_9FLOR|nr:allophycocyanin beta 18 subunit [Platysiphonia delicata]ARW59551.1 allophycocyanin beta 18 subunit [Platysiphonia delicata]
MKDAITKIVNQYDLTGKYFDTFAIKELNNYFFSGLDRLKTLEVINSNASKIVKETAARLYNEQPELLRPGGNSYTTRRYAACLRDIEYYLRYATYALIAGDIDILNDRVLDGLKETYNSLNVPIAPTIRSIKLLEEVVKNEIDPEKVLNPEFIKEPFEYMVISLSEQNT